MDHAALIASISKEDRLRLTRKSDARGLLHLAAHLGVIACLMLWIALGAPLWGFALLPLGVALVFLFTLEHEATHKTPFATPWLNEAAGHLAGLFLLLPFEWFRLFHMAHHRHTNDPQRDPELAGPKPDTWPRFIVHVSGLPYWRAMAGVLWENAFSSSDAPYLTRRARPKLKREARAYLAIYALALTSLFLTPVAFWLWLLPVLLGQPFLRLYLLAEHGRCPPVANMLENSRTTFTNRIVRFLAWNMPYHAEHHAYPGVPFHQLPALHAHAKAHLKSTSPGYIAFVDEYVDSLEKPA
ncbi:MAG: fatty acid desaturase [Pseudomonadota bacterium]